MILIINGPNLNMLGRREPEIYGTTTLDEVQQRLNALYPGQLHWMQSNHEGAIIDCLNATMGNAEVTGIVINPGAFAHTSLAIADAIAMLEVPVIEVHISNIFARKEAMRHASVTAAVCRGVISGAGVKGYELAVRALLS